MEHSGDAGGMGDDDPSLHQGFFLCLCQAQPNCRSGAHLLGEVQQRPRGIGGKPGRYRQARRQGGERSAKCSFLMRSPSSTSTPLLLLLPGSVVYRSRMARRPRRRRRGTDLNRCSPQLSQEAA